MDDRSNFLASLVDQAMSQVMTTPGSFIRRIKGLVAAGDLTHEDEAWIWAAVGDRFAKRVDSRKFTIDDKVTEHVAAHMMCAAGTGSLLLWKGLTRLVLFAVKHIQESATPIFADLPSFCERVSDVMLEQNPVPKSPHEGSFGSHMMSHRDSLANSVIKHMVGQMASERVLDEPLSGFADIKEHSAARQVRDCAVVALAITCNTSYRKAEGVLREVGRVDHDGTHIKHTRAAIRALGYEFRELPMSYYLGKLTARGNPAKYLQPAHVMRFPDVFTDSVNHRQIWFTPQHMFAFTGKVEDPRPEARCKVREVFDVFPMGQVPPRDESAYKGCYIFGQTVQFRRRSLVASHQIKIAGG